MADERWYRQSWQFITNRSIEAVVSVAFDELLKKGFCLVFPNGIESTAYWYIQEAAAVRDAIQAGLPEVPEPIRALGENYRKQSFDGDTGVADRRVWNRHLGWRLFEYRTVLSRRSRAMLLTKMQVEAERKDGRFYLVFDRSSPTMEPDECIWICDPPYFNGDGSLRRTNLAEYRALKVDSRLMRNCISYLSLVTTLMRGSTTLFTQLDVPQAPDP